MKFITNYNEKKPPHYGGFFMASIYFMMKIISVEILESIPIEFLVF
jgi:hypothetical protein